jgi:hypothetical protein
MVGGAGRDVNGLFLVLPLLDGKGTPSWRYCALQGERKSRRFPGIAMSKNLIGGVGLAELESGDCWLPPEPGAFSKVANAGGESALFKERERPRRRVPVLQDLLARRVELCGQNHE